MSTGADEAMLFDVYGRYLLEVTREEDRWVPYRVDGGRKRQVTDFAIPAELNAEEVERYLDDMLHEAARPDRSLRRVQ